MTRPTEYTDLYEKQPLIVTPDITLTLGAIVLGRSYIGQAKEIKPYQSSPSTVYSDLYLP